jgi:serine/threonine-protein kinase
MSVRDDGCLPGRIRGLVEGRLTVAEQAGLEVHLDSCADCRAELDRLVVSDPLLDAAPRGFETCPSAPAGRAAAANVRLDFLSPTDWPDSLGRLGTYEVTGVLGRGGMGLVLKAHDPALGRPVAIKVMADSLAGCAASRRRFLREARAAAAVVHGNVAAVHGVGERVGQPYIVMEYVAGRSLQDRLDRVGPPSVPAVVRIAMQAARGLAAAHSQGLVHRDVKPANILLENGVERVKLVDFGLARAADDASLTHSGVVAGTPLYMSPEQARGEAVDARSDLFSLGCTIYAMCAGHPPFRADSPLAVLRRITDEQPRPLREVNPEVPAWLEEVVGRLLAKDPADRPDSAADVADHLTTCLAHLERPLDVPPPTGLDRAKAKPAPSAPRRRRAIAISAAAIGLAGALVLAGAWGAWRGTRDRAPHGGGRPDARSVAADADANDAAVDGDGEALDARIRANSQRARALIEEIRSEGQAPGPRPGALD